MSSLPSAADVREYFQENAIIGETRRFRQLDRFESHYVTTQYSHQMTDWWGMPADSQETVSPEVMLPLGYTQPALKTSVRNRRPTAPYNLAKAIVDRFTGLLFSDTRKPDVSVEGDPDTEDFVIAATEQMRFWAKMREARTMGGAIGSVLVTVHLRAGKFCLEVHNTKYIQPLWKDKRVHELCGVLKLYKYPVEEDIRDDKTGEIKGTKITDYLYRRIITEDDDVVFKPVKLEPGAGLNWEPENEVKHGLGFFPGVWIQNLPVLDQEDGDPDCAGAWQGFDTYDRILSQMNKAALLNLDPTLQVKVDPKVVAAQGGTIMKGSDSALYVGEGGNASYVEITGSGIEAGSKVAALIKSNVLDVTRCVMVDPQTLSGSAQSAKAIEYIYAPMLEKADDLRAQYGELGVVPLLLLVERMARKFFGQTTRMATGKVGAYSFALPPRRDGKPRVLGPGGWISIKWGPYFAPTEQDKQIAISNIVAAKSGGLLDHENAVKQAAPSFGLHNPDEIFKKVKLEQQEEMEILMGGMGEGGVPPEASEPVQPPAGEGGKV